MIGIVRRALAALLIPSAMAAQTVAVQAADEATGRGLPGALVTLRDARGRIVARHLADANGRVTVTAPSAGRHTVRVDAIGYRGVTSDPLELRPNAPESLRVALVGAPLPQEELRVVGDRRVVCRLDLADGEATSRLWEEAGKALAGTTVGRTSQPLRLRVDEFERRLDVAERVMSERRSTHVTGSQRPFVAVDPEELHKNGWVQNRSDGVWFHGPDADLLLSERFLDDHCFRIGRADADLIGLDFEPVRSRRLPDVRGTLWLDARSLELRFLEFGFTGFRLPPEARGIGGRVEFTRLPTGPWYINRWHIRMPVFVKLRKNYGQVDSLTAYREAGGEASVVAAGVATNPGATMVVGTVFDSLAGTGLSDVVVSLAGVPRDTTGPAGEFAIASPGVGQYLVTFDHPRFAQVGLGQLRAAASLRRGEVDTVRVAVPGPATLFSRVCGGEPREGVAGLTVAVVDGAGRPIPGATVTITAPELRAVRATDKPRSGRLAPRVSFGPRGVSWRGTTDGAGTLIVCGPIRGRSLEAQVASGARTVTQAIAADDEPFRLASITLPD